MSLQLPSTPSEQDNQSEATLQTDAEETHNNQHAPEDRIADFSSNLLERGNLFRAFSITLAEMVHGSSDEIYLQGRDLHV